MDGICVSFDRVDNVDGIEGIGGDRKFIEYLYNYNKLREAFRNHGEGDEEKNKILNASVTNYVNAITHCTNQIVTLKNEAEIKKYLNWLRWNSNEIRREITKLQQLCERDRELAETVRNCKENLERFGKTLFQLLDAERGIANEYFQSLAIARRSKRYKIAFQAGKLFINYVHLLIKKFCFAELDRPEMTFEILEKDAGDIRSLVERNNCEISEKLIQEIEKVAQLFKTMRMLDSKLKLADEENVKLALELAALRDKETFLEKLLRGTNETIFVIKRTLREGVKTVDDAVGSLLRGVYKVTVGKAVELFVWSMNNPFKAIGITIAGITIACVAISALPTLLPTVLPASLATAETVAYVEAFCALPMVAAYPTLLGAEVGILMKLGKKVRQSFSSSSSSSSRAPTEEPGRKNETLEVAKVAESADKELVSVHEEFRRKRNRETEDEIERWEKKEREIREYEKRIKEETERKIAAMGREELMKHKETVEAKYEEFNVDLNDVRNERIRAEMNYRREQENYSKISEGLSAAGIEIDEALKTSSRIPNPTEIDLQDIQILKVIFVIVIAYLFYNYCLNLIRWF